MATKSGITPPAADVDSSPAVVNGVVYIGSDDDNVYALNAANGAKSGITPPATILFIRLLLLSTA